MLRLALLLLFFAGFARAEGDGLEGSYDEQAPVSGGAGGAERTPSPDPEAPLGEDEEPPPRAPDPLPKISPRFGLEERARFHRWLAGLCRQEPVDADTAERVRFTRDRSRSFARATNKQGSLLLLLQNYAELAQFRDDCEAERKKDAQACVHKGRIPKPWDVKDGRFPWLAFGSHAFQTEVTQGRAPAGIEPRTDLLRASEEQLKKLQAALKKDFFELRDAADLDGKPGSAAKARSLLTELRASSTCGTRAVSEGPEKRRAPAQK